MGQLIKTYAACEIAEAVAAVADLATLVQLIKTAPSTPAHNMGLVNLTITLTTAVASAFGLAYAADNGTAAPGQQLGVRVSTGNGGVGTAVQGSMNTAWTAVPLYDAPPSYLRRENLPAVIGSKISWDWPEDDPLLLSSPDNSASILLRNLTGGACAATLVSARWLEYIKS